MSFGSSGGISKCARVAFIVIARSLAESISVPSRSKISSNGEVKFRGHAHARHAIVSDFAFAEKTNLSIVGGRVPPARQRRCWHRAALWTFADTAAWARARRPPARSREP